MNAWSILETPPLHPEENMRICSDRLAQISPKDNPSLRFYNFLNPSATFGYFTNPWEFLNKEAIEKQGFLLAKRPTGGGIIFHGCDLAFSILIPASHPHFSQNTLENYAYVNTHLLKALKIFDPTLKISFHLECQKREKSEFCMTKSTVYDLIIDGHKVAGGAQRQTKKGFLHQGSISLGFLNEELIKKVLKNPSVLEEMKNLSYFFKYRNRKIESVKHHLKDLLVQTFTGESQEPSRCPNSYFEQ